MLRNTITNQSQHDSNIVIKIKCTNNKNNNNNTLFYLKFDNSLSKLRFHTD